jgi:hypothetical protein
MHTGAVVAMTELEYHMFGVTRPARFQVELG